VFPANVNHLMNWILGRWFPSRLVRGRRPGPSAFIATNRPLWKDRDSVPRRTCVQPRSPISRHGTTELLPGVGAVGLVSPHPKLRALPNRR
jgi:hypothetical protein